MRVIGSVGVISYGVAGVFAGLAQQRPELPQEKIDCEYRVYLLRERVVARLDQSRPKAQDANRGDPLSTLLRESQAACSDDPELARRIDTIQGQLAAHQARIQHDARARQELLAL